MNKVLIYKDELKISERINELEAIAEKLQEHLNPLFDLKDEPLNIADLHTLYQNPKAFFTNILIPDNTHINGLSLNKEKMFELLELPNEVKNSINQISEFIKDWHITGKYLQYLEVVNDEIKVSQNTLTAIDLQHSVYIETPEDKAVFEALQNIQNGMQTILNNTPFSTVFSIHLFKLLFKVGEDFNGTATNGNSVFEINYNYFRK